MAVGVMGMCLQVSMVAYMFSMSFGAAVNTRVSNELGAGRALCARTSAFTALGMVLGTQSMVAVTCLAASRGIVRALTNNEEVEAATLQVMGLLAATFVPDGLNAVSMGVLRASGRQGLGAALNLVGYWCIGVPLSALLGLHLKLSTIGFWTSLLVTSSLQSCVNVYVMFRLDWHQEVSRAQMLVGTEHLDATSLAAASSAAAAEEGSGVAPGSGAAAAGKGRHSSCSSSSGDQGRHYGSRSGLDVCTKQNTQTTAAAAGGGGSLPELGSSEDGKPVRGKFLQNTLKWLEKRRKQQAEQRQQQGQVYKAVAADEPPEERKPLLLNPWRSLTGRLSRQISSREEGSTEDGGGGSSRVSDSSSSISLATFREQRRGQL